MMVVNQVVATKRYAGLFGQLVTVRPLLALLLATLAAMLAQPLYAHADNAGVIVNASALQGLITDEGLCGPGGYRLVDTDLCTHGPDGDPTASEFAQLEDSSPASGVTSSVRCDGDGVSGKRVQVLYVRSEDAPDRYADVLTAIRREAADADALFDASAHETGGHRHIRFVTTPSCEIDVLPVVLSAGADSTFSGSLTALRSQGFSDVTRKYLMFVDSKVYCGIASVVSDNRPGSENRSNLIAGYARVDRSCWDAISVAHELAHTLGGIQHTAPNSSGGWHCTDENDVMCYSDTPYYPAINYVCTAGRFHSLLDCNHDDYFHTNPAAGSYLANHWNVANSEFLIADEDDHAALPALALAIDAGAAAMTVGAEVAIEVALPETFADGSYGYTVQRVEYFYGAVLVASVDTAPYRLAWRADVAGDHTISAVAYDQNGQSSPSLSFTFAVASPTNQPTALNATLLPMIMN